jgi:uncharacterized transporter YbjL
MINVTVVFLARADEIIGRHIVRLSIRRSDLILKRLDRGDREER